MKTVCCVCHITIIEGDEPPNKVSHGYCKVCAALQLAELQQFTRERPKCLIPR